MPISSTEPLRCYVTDTKTGLRHPSMMFSLDQFREIYSARTHGPLAGPQGSLFTDLTSWLISTPELTLLDPDTYACVLDLHLEEIMLDIMARDDFYDEPSIISACIVRGLNAAMGWTYEHDEETPRETAAAQRIVSRVESVSEAMWRNRGRLPYYWPHIDDFDKPEPVASLCLLLLHMCDRAKRVPDILLKVLLHVWLAVPYRPNMLDDAFRIHTQYLCSKSTVDVDAYVQDAIVDGIGADAFILRLLEDAKREDVSDWYLSALLEVIRFLGLSRPLLPYFVKHRCLDTLTPIIEKRCVPGEDEYRGLLYARSFALIYLATTKRTVDVHGACLVDVYARGIDIIAAGVPLEQKHRRQLRTCIRTSTEQIVLSGTHVGVSLPEMKSRAKDIWWPALTRLQATHYITQGDGESKKFLPGLLGQWESFGKACGLDAEKERKRHRREGRAFCTWAACQWSTVKPPDGVSLKACQGCGEAHYCGRECQRNDWGEGGHKARCGTRVKGT